MKFSVIIPVYNLERWIDGCLSSVERQICTDWECICVDDGSEDRSLAVLRAYGQRDARFKVFVQEHSGVGAARNLGMSKAEGEWVVFVDGDDIIDETWLDTISRTADAHKSADIVVMPNGIVEFHNPGGIAAGKAKPFAVSRHRALSGRRARWWAQKRYSRDGWAVLSAVRRSFIGETRFDENVRIKEDVLFFLELSRRIDVIAISNASGYYYRQRPGSALNSPRSIEDGVRLLEVLSRYPPSMRENASRVACWDLIQWMRSGAGNCESSSCLLLEKWRELIDSGALVLSAMRWWWRPGIQHWLRTGDMSWLSATWKLRLAVACTFRWRGQSGRPPKSDV